MALPGGYDTHKAVEAARFRNRERDLDHMRALRELQPADGFLSRIVGRLRAPHKTELPAMVFEAHELTERVCRMTDGAVGRVAVRETGGAWVARCVPVA